MTDSLVITLCAPSHELSFLACPYCIRQARFWFRHTIVALCSPSFILRSFPHRHCHQRRQTRYFSCHNGYSHQRWSLQLILRLKKGLESNERHEFGTISIKLIVSSKLGCVPWFSKYFKDKLRLPGSAKRGCRAEFRQTMRFVSVSGTGRCQRNSLGIGRHKSKNEFVCKSLTYEMGACPPMGCSRVCDTQSLHRLAVLSRRICTGSMLGPCCANTAFWSWQYKGEQTPR